MPVNKDFCRTFEALGLWFYEDYCRLETYKICLNLKNYTLGL